MYLGMVKHEGYHLVRATVPQIMPYLQPRWLKSEKALWISWDQTDSHRQRRRTISNLYVYTFLIILQYHVTRIECLFRKLFQVFWLLFMWSSCFIICCCNYEFILFSDFAKIPKRISSSAKVYWLPLVATNSNKHRVMEVKGSSNTQGLA